MTAKETLILSLHQFLIPRFQSAAYDLAAKPHRQFVCGRYQILKAVDFFLAKIHLDCYSQFIHLVSYVVGKLILLQGGGKGYMVLPFILANSNYTLSLALTGTAVSGE